MSRLANAVRFGESGSGGSWYDPPLPTSLAEVQASWPQYEQRAAWLHERFPTGKIAIAGTGHGWTQYFLFANYQRQSWGCDIAWATSRAQGVLGAARSSWIGAHDVTNATQMTAFRRMGNTGQARYDVLLTEDLLPCANSDAEVTTILTRLRAVGIQLVHLITPLDPNTQQTPDMLWRTPAQWRAMIGPNEMIVGPDLVEWP